MVGLAPAGRSQIVDLLDGLTRHDEEAMLEVLLDWRGEEAINEAQLAGELGELAFDYADVQLLKIAALLHRLTAILRRHAIVLPADLTMMFKALITLEGASRRYDPELRLIERVKPFLERAMLERYQPADALQRGQAMLGDFAGLITSLPRNLARLLKDVRHGRLRVDLDMKRLASLGDRLDSTIDRMTIGIMTASLVIGSSIVMMVSGGPIVFDVHLLTWCGLLGYAGDEGGRSCVRRYLSGGNCFQCPTTRASARTTRSPSPVPELASDYLCQECPVAPLQMMPEANLVVQPGKSKKRRSKFAIGPPRRTMSSPMLAAMPMVILLRC